MWQRIHASFSYGKKHQCISYICKMYVNIYEPKTSSTKMNKKKENTYCVCLSKCLQHFYSNTFNLHVSGTLESLHTQNYTKSNSQINRLIGFGVIKQSIISIKLCNTGTISFHRGNVPSSRCNCAGKHFILQRPCTTHMWKINAKLLILTCKLLKTVSVIHVGIIKRDLGY